MQTQTLETYKSASTEPTEPVIHRDFTPPPPNASPSSGGGVEEGGAGRGCGREVYHPYP
ncbi:hypothetical protein E2C01_084007 [Portunus trituberculatus]|uniref:Uncharacterized protein n=1 Tax=Portunus trituberculatus TaxID=210409 RepID=A0A5B7J815_PORTR|nr:hypothetical protein [Portunus trituberculatus]